MTNYDEKECNPKIAEFIGQELQATYKGVLYPVIEGHLELCVPWEPHKDYNQAVAALIYISKNYKATITIEIRDSVQEPIEVMYDTICKFIQDGYTIKDKGGYGDSRGQGVQDNPSDSTKSADVSDNRAS